MAKRKITKMSKALFQRWCEALRSGKYRQGKGSLKRKLNQHASVFCCLGILDELANNPSESAAHIFSYKDGGSILIKSDLQVTLSGLNDNLKMNFLEIADYLEKQTEIKNGMLVLKEG